MYREKLKLLPSLKSNSIFVLIFGPDIWNTAEFKQNSYSESVCLLVQAFYLSIYHKLFCTNNAPNELKMILVFLDFTYYEFYKSTVCMFYVLLSCSVSKKCKTCNLAIIPVNQLCTMTEFANFDYVMQMVNMKNW